MSAGGAEKDAALALSIVIVNWNLRDMLMDCIASVEKETLLPRNTYEIIVVDNASTDGSVETGKARFPGVRWVMNPVNAGFAAACNTGFELCRGRYIMLLNPDTLVLDHAIDGMLEEFERRPGAGVLGSRLVNKHDLSFQRAGGGAFPSLGNVASNYLFLNRLLPRTIAPAPVFMDGDPRGVIEIDWVSGAAMLLRREAVGDRIFDESFFMYGEDMELCHRLRNNGWQVLYCGKTSILHYHGESYKKQSSLEVLELAIKGPREFFKRCHKPSHVLIYDMILLSGYVFRYMLYNVLSLVRPRRGYDVAASFSGRHAVTVLRLLRGSKGTAV